MRVARTILICLLAVFFPAIQTTSSDKPALTWIHIDWQPAWIFDGPLKGMGYAQTVERMLQERLTGYEHFSREVTNVRIYSILQNRDACFAASPYQGADLQDDKRHGVIWSAPSYIYFLHGLIAKPESVERINEYAENGYVDFEALMQDESIVGAFQPSRAYSRWLHPLFEDEEKAKNMFKWSGDSELTQSMFRMLEAGRIDYFVDYVIMLKYHEESTGTPSGYAYIPIKEHKGFLGLGAIACSDTPLGRQAIKDINAVLKTIRQSDEVREVNRRWLMPKEQEAEYWRMWETELLPLEK